MPKFLVSGPKDKKIHDAHVINTTSRSNDVGINFSPFRLGPIDVILPEFKRYKSMNMENAWQFCKVYKDHVDENEDPTDEWLEWAKNGWKDKWAHRYPMGKGAKPLYSYWGGEKLGYIQARKRIYIPMYMQLVNKSPYFPVIVREVQRYLRLNKTVILWDYDGYDADAKFLDYIDVMLDDTRPMGHAFILREMIIERLNEENEESRF